MVIKTFNVNQDIYNKFNSYCKEIGLSMSKQVDMFMRSQIEENPKVRQEYIDKLERLKKGEFVRLKGSLIDRYKNV